MKFSSIYDTIPLMRRARITYPGAFHHAMNRGHDGQDIFQGNKNKAQFLDFLTESAKKMKIRLFAYCIMDNHYHLVLENANGTMSECLKRVNSLYGMYYRKANGGKGYVFQDRFKSTLIEKDTYLLHSIAYLLRNPVRAGLVRNGDDYIWSSIKSYYSDTDTKDDMVDHEFVNELFETKEMLLTAIQTWGVREPSITITDYGEVWGSEDFLKSALKKFDRRKRPTDQGKGNQRKRDRYFDPVEKVFMEFERIKGIKTEEIKTYNYEGKRQRADLLVMLKDNAGLTYQQIGEILLFGDLNSNSLRAIYRNTKKRKQVELTAPSPLPGGESQG